MWFRRRRKFKPVPPDHPMFNGQVFFAFQNELPEKPDEGPHITPADEDAVEFLQPNVPNRLT